VIPRAAGASIKPPLRGKRNQPGVSRASAAPPLDHIIMKPSARARCPREGFCTQAAKPSSPTANSPSPAAKSTHPAVESTHPAVESTFPAVESTHPAVESTHPAVESTPPAVESTPPAVESTPPAVESTFPAVESTPPAVESTPPAVESLFSSANQQKQSAKLLPTFSCTPCRLARLIYRVNAPQLTAKEGWLAL
jgi:hypothetical protein